MGLFWNGRGLGLGQLDVFFILIDFVLCRFFSYDDEDLILFMVIYVFFFS